MMNEHYVSDTLAGSANQAVFESDGQPHRARVYYRLFTGGNAPRTLTFSAVIDSTFDDGSRSRCGDRCAPYDVSDMRVGMVTASDMNIAVMPLETVAVTFGGASRVTVTPDTPVVTDAFTVDADKGAFLCVEFTYRGTTLPCHEELQIPSFCEENGVYAPSKHLPVPLMVGVRRPVEKRVAFLGDSITQGIGATPNGYRHWNALVADAFGERYAFWNLGIGFARSGDASSDGEWLARAKQNDVVIVCLGTNDILRGVEAQTVVDNLTVIVRRLKDAGATVLLQSVPPFEYYGENGRRKQRYINERLATIADDFFDNTAFLTAPDGMPRYGGHPNDEGCAVWAMRLTAWLKERGHL